MSIQITLYQKCILTNDYKEGFNMRIPSSIDTYLATLDKLQVYSGDDIYYTNNGTISIENSGLTIFSANLYNYMVFSSSTNGVLYKRYCFIKSITLVNEVAIVSYEEDIWTNYSSSMVLRYGYLTQAKRINTLTNEETFLPKNYNSNQPVTLSSITGGTANKCYVVLDMNFYRLAQDGSLSNRLFYSILLGNRKVEVDSSQQEIGTPVFSYDWDCDDDLEAFLTQLKMNSSVNEIVNTLHYGSSNIQYDSQNPYYYEITRVLLIPYNVGYGLFHTKYLVGNELRKTMDNNPLYNRIGYKLSDLGSTYWKTSAIMYTLSIIGGDYQAGYSGLKGNTGETYKLTISNDYTIKGLQNNNRFIAIDMNGKTVDIQYRFTAHLSGSSLLLNINDEILDITGDYTFNIPLSAQTADVTQQATIARNLSELNNGFNQLGNIWSGITGSANAIKQDSSMGFMGAFYGAMIKDEALQASREAITAKKSVSNKAVSNINEALFNASIAYGFLLAKITATNSDDVSRFISKFGYAYDNILVSDTHVFDSTASDNYLRFSNAVIYGGFSDEIATILKNILLNGIYLFGSSTV